MEKELAKGKKHACHKLDELMKHTLHDAGKHGLSYAEAGQLLDAANSVGALLGCDPAGSPNAAAESDLVALMGTIDGMSLKDGEANDLIGKAREAALELVEGRPDEACKKLDELAKKIDKDTGKKDKLTAGQGAALSAAVAQIGSELGC